MSAGAGAGGKIRRLEQRDLPELVDLCREHAAFERAPWNESVRREEGLARLFLGAGKAFCWVVEVPGGLGGFVSANLELSTWDAQEYVHLDCIFLREAHRGRGWGRALVERVARAALEHRAVNVQWQTPVWNEDAIRFYRRLGAGENQKLRFTLDREACAALFEDPG